MASKKPDRKKKGTLVDPLAVTESLGLQTFRKGRKPWTKEEDEILSRLISEHHDVHLLTADDVKWEEVAQEVSPEGIRKAKDCRKRWFNSLDPNVRKGKWLMEEDAMLLSAYQKHGALWQKVANEIPGRTDDQCSKRYLEVLDPKTKDRLKPWNEAEDLLLIRLVKEHGTKWRTISNSMPGRPLLTCRNRWRKIATDVFRQKANETIKREVEKITNLLVKNLAGLGQDDSKLPEFQTGSDKKSEILLQLDLVQLNQQQKLHQGTEMAIGTSSQQKSHNQNILHGLRPTRGSSEVEWRYSFVNYDDNDGELPHQRLFSDSQGGVVSNQELVQYLISYAKSFNLDIAVHQHIHHHYAPPQTAATSQSPSTATPPVEYSNTVKNPVSTPYSQYGQFESSTGNSYGNSTPGSSSNRIANGVPPPGPSAYYLEPETQLNRYQHFNYLPPLTEVPKLNSSNSSPSNSSKGSTHHHHHHHHHHVVTERKQNGVNQKGQTSNSTQYGDQRSNNRENIDLTKILNGDKREHLDIPKTNNSGGGGGGGPGTNSANESNALTPLTQAVEFVTAAELQIVQGKGSNNTINDMQNRKRPRLDDEEEGMDFWELMRNLSDLPQYQQQQQQQFQQQQRQQQHQHQQQQQQQHQHQQQQQQRDYNARIAQNNANISRASVQKPVSQHHPLHSYNSPLMSNPLGTLAGAVGQGVNDEEDEEELDEDGMATYGILYSVFSKDNSQNPEASSNHNTNNNGGANTTAMNSGVNGVYDASGNNKDTHSVSSEATSRLSPYETMLGFGALPFNPS